MAAGESNDLATSGGLGPSSLEDDTDVSANAFVRRLLQVKSVGQAWLPTSRPAWPDNMPPFSLLDPRCFTADELEILADIVVMRWPRYATITPHEATVTDNEIYAASTAQLRFEWERATAGLPFRARPRRTAFLPVDQQLLGWRIISTGAAVLSSPGSKDVAMSRLLRELDMPVMSDTAIAQEAGTFLRYFAIGYLGIYVERRRMPA